MQLKNKPESKKHQQWKQFQWVMLLCVTNLYILSACSQKSQNEVKKVENAQVNAVKKIISIDAKSLIEAIVSSNAAPTMKGGTYHGDPHGDPQFDENFDWTEYKRVNNAIDFLACHAEEAWPELLKHFEDKRYSTTTQSEGYGNNYDVGGICKLIVTESLTQGYRKHFGLLSVLPYWESAYHAINIPENLDKEELKEWCIKRKNKNLFDLQIEMCEWAISTIKNSKKLAKLTIQERKPFMDAVQMEIDLLKKTKKALVFSGFRGYEDFEPYQPSAS
jgi:hypothetical protein